MHRKIDVYRRALAGEFTGHDDWLATGQAAGYSGHRDLVAPAHMYHAFVTRVASSSPSASRRQPAGRWCRPSWSRAPHATRVRPAL
ncbi:MAG TPA: hypothetical protein VNT55_00245 [Baekduia sp.]|nr:hypothetical protein [Baekduia sp.]